MGDFLPPPLPPQDGRHMYMPPPSSPNAARRKRVTRRRTAAARWSTSGSRCTERSAVRSLSSSRKTRARISSGGTPRWPPWPPRHPNGQSRHLNGRSRVKMKQYVQGGPSGSALPFVVPSQNSLLILKGNSQFDVNKTYSAQPDGPPCSCSSRKA